jgi:UDP-sulfoquinovose synthase
MESCSGAIEFCCRTWGLRATDLNQGVVYGQVTDQTVLDDRLETRFDYDAVFGTVLNRFIVQAALSEPITVDAKVARPEGCWTRGTRSAASRSRARTRRAR